jgi:lipopolysaccharide/colanic/teichoic acid biosynthesis glycosyltransferase
MRVNADKQGLITLGGRDPRVTRSGYYIRKYKLDEFPQLINVLIGDMSLVGPRPEVRKYVELYTPEQMHVLDVRPGITSLASIRYRNENDILAAAENPDRCYVEQVMPDKLAIDLEYVNKASLWNDIRLIFSTFKEIITK